MSHAGCGKRNCRCKTCQKILVLKLKDLDKTTRMNQVRECLLDLYIKPNPDLKTGQLVTFQEDIHDIYGNGLLHPIKINVEVPVEVSKNYSKKENGIWCLGKSKKGGCLGFNKGTKGKNHKDINLKVKLVIDNDKRTLKVKNQ